MYSKNSEADKFYTKIQNLPDLSAFLELNTGQKYLEPSVGSGALLGLIPGENCVCFDLYPDSNLGFNVIHADFLEVNIIAKNLITIMNPPFGKNSSLAIKFFNKCASVSKKIICIVPLTFNKKSVTDKLDPFFSLVYSSTLPEKSFTVSGEDYAVPCCVQVWIKTDSKRIIQKNKTTTDLFEFGTFEDHDFAIRRAGSKAGKVISHNKNVDGIYWIKGSEEILELIKQCDFSQVVSNTSGVRSLSKMELISIVEEKYNGI